MNCSEHNLLLYEKDELLKHLITEYLSYTTVSETISTSFKNFILHAFTGLKEDVIVKFFDIKTCGSIDNELWAKSTAEVLARKEYPYHYKIGVEYYRSIILDFLSKNTQVLINDFVIKFCTEKEIREKLINELLYEAKEDANVGNLLSKYLNKELVLRAEERLDTTYEFYTYSKEVYSFMLPVLEDKAYRYNVVLQDNEGVAKVVGLENNELRYYPPVVQSSKIIIAEIQVLNHDMHIISRKYLKITVHRQKYHPKQFKVYKVEKTTKIKVLLEDVEEKYSYTATVPEGFGEADLVTTPGFLEFTAPDVLQEQTVSVKLSLNWSDEVDTVLVYETPIIFNIKMDGLDVDKDDAAE